MERRTVAEPNSACDSDPDCYSSCLHTDCFHSRTACVAATCNGFAIAGTQSSAHAPLA